MPIEITARLTPIPGIIKKPLGLSPLGPLAPLVGTWHGNGFNQIFRPLQPANGSDNFLELNLTEETLEFTEIPGEIPNRGLVQPDISLFGMTYLQQINDANVKDAAGNPAGLHVEPGIWINIPATTDPPEVATVARLATIPHGTSLLAQGTAQVVSGPPTFPAVDITPFTIGNPSNKIHFASQDLSVPSNFRSPPADIVGITQAMVDNPNSVLASALAGKTITSHTVIRITTTSSSSTVPNAGGGVADIAFLDGVGGRPNARVHQMEATFWISNYVDASGRGTLLQYSQTVLLDFAPLSWPHVSVANLLKPAPKTSIKDLKDNKSEAKDNKIEVKEHKPEIKETKENKPEIKEIKENKPEVKEIKENKLEIKEIEHKVPDIPGPGPLRDNLRDNLRETLRASPAESAPGHGRHFIAPVERPEVGESVPQDEPKPTKKE